MKKLSLLLLVFMLCMIQVYSFDIGLDLSNTSAVSYVSEATLIQKNQAILKGSFSFDSIDVVLGGLYEFYGSFPFSGSVSEIVPWRFDAAESYIALAFPKLFGEASQASFKLGRFLISDYSSKILNSQLDGFLFSTDLSNVTVFFNAGYTGLLYKNDANIFLSQADKDFFLTNTLFAPSRIVTGIGIKSLELLPLHDMGLELYAQFDTAPTNAVHTQYAEAYVDGRINQNFKWRMFAILCARLPDTVTQYAASAGLRFKASFPELLALRISQETLWASGSFDSLLPFLPINQSTLATVFGGAFTDSIVPSLELSINPISILSIGLKGTGIFRSTLNAPADITFPETSSSYYLGSEAGLTFNLRPTSDLSVNAALGAFIPNTVDAYAVASPVRYFGAVNLVFSL